MKTNTLSPELLHEMDAYWPFGAVFDNPDLIVACVVGDGETETDN